MKAVVVLSGGLDSCVALTQTLKKATSVRAISFYYGQRHQKELQAARDISSELGVEHEVRDVILGHSGLLMEHDREMVHATYEELKAAEGPSPTYVPYRNGSFLSLATSYALAEGMDTVVAGMHAEDAHNWAYPDCTPEFIGAMQNAIYIGTYMQVRLVCPFTYMTKAQIVELGLKIGAPLDLTWSCYESGKVACGRCPTCIGRLEAFKANGVQDPIMYSWDQYYGGRSMTRGVVSASLKLQRSLDET